MVKVFEKHLTHSTTTCWVWSLVKHGDLDFNTTGYKELLWPGCLAFVFPKHHTAPPKEQQRQPPFLQLELKMNTTE